MFRKNSCFYASSPSSSCASQRAVYPRPKYSNQNFCKLIWFRGLFELRTLLLIYLFRSFELFFLLQIDFLLLFCLLWLYYNIKTESISCFITFGLFVGWTLRIGLNGFFSFWASVHSRAPDSINQSALFIKSWTDGNTMPSQKALTDKLFIWIYIWNISPSGHPLF